MAATNQASSEVVSLLIESYPDALHLQNDDGMTPLDLALADESASETVVAMLEGRPPPPEMTRRQKAENFIERAEALERKLNGMRDRGGRQHTDLREALSAVRRLADRFPHALYSAGIDPNELEIALSNAVVADEGGLGGHNTTMNADEAELVILDAVKKRAPLSKRMENRGGAVSQGAIATVGEEVAPSDRIEDLLSSMVAIDHVKSQVRGLRRSTEISDLRESLIPHEDAPQSRTGGPNLAFLPPILSDDSARPHASHMVFIGNPGTGKSATARLLSKCFHELGILRKPKFFEVERMDLVGNTPKQTRAKCQEIFSEARGGVLFIDEAYTLAMPTKRSTAEAGINAIEEIIHIIDSADEDKEQLPLIFLAGFPQEMQSFLASQGGFRRRFSLTFEFPDYTCTELAQIFIDLSFAKGFYLEESLTVISIGQLLEQETSQDWRSDRNGRVCELLLGGARTQIRKRMRIAALDDVEVDPQLIIMSDVENVIREQFH